ncbi:MAG: hypothetical protein AAFU55_14775 [Pseudomonadota bacterium]
MSRVTRIALAAALVCAATVAMAEDAERDGLARYEVEGWTIEVVRDGDRAACSLIREDPTGAALVVSRVSDSPFVLPVMEIVAERDPFGAGPVVLAAAATRTEAELDTFYDEDGVHVAAYPPLDMADPMMEAMQVAGDVRLEQNGEAVASMPLTGFTAAFAEITRVCGG